LCAVGGLCGFYAKTPVISSDRGKEKCRAMSAEF
jgi:hypothetical protein